MAQKTARAIERASEIDLLASPTRIEIVDTLEALGRAVSVAELAGELGRPADGLYYHLRQLARGGLIEEETAPDGRRFRLRTESGARLSLRYRPGATANARAVGRVAASVLRVAERDFKRALGDPGAVVEGPRRELWAARGKGWVGPDQLTEINRLLGRLMELLHQPRTPEHDTLIAVSWVLAPLEPKSPRRAPERKPAQKRIRARPG
ncbi:winged helix-turn-helix domain-containing protein [Dokdonella immobilis]|uniref:Helix-turn-helix domain-containing protein n=1 Tax=Dokdonella immobilis TaxID=578942 RepID=A0A1I5B6H2_9GAMM|nr:winged helix-turn-helix domain-containing protein [Dokdonella immobilis]SFN70307.1 Helix-turn-helix domain-containing protein [Dokdonella immobilis]